MDLSLLYNEYKTSSGISTDTRKINQGQLFFALRGPNFNANKLAEEAVRKGARMAVIDDPEYAFLPQTYLVKDSLKALQQLAAYHRDTLDIPIIGLTGSNGKTTTKELIKVILEQKYKLLATAGNLNNHIGVPLTILSITEEHDIAVVEMGANHVGEIAELCSIAKPTHGLITNIGKAHIGEFGGFENVIRAKSELFDFLLKNNGVAFINNNDPVLNKMSDRFSTAHSFPSGGECNIEYIEADPFLKVKFNNEEIPTKLVGTYNFSNVAGAICVGKFFDVDEYKIMQAVQSYVPSNNRSQLLEAGTNTILLDAYNANPSSMQEAVKNFSRIKAESKILILGDMLELGDETIHEHYVLGQLVKDLEFTQVYFVGPLMQSAVDAFPAALHFEDKLSLVAYLKLHPISNSHILIKGSRGMALEQLVEAFTAH